MTQKNVLADMFQQGGKALGLNDEASSQLIANLNGTTVPMCVGDPFTAGETETDDFRLLGFAIDASGSMDVVENEVRSSFNEIIMPGLLGGAAPQVGAIRYNGLKFGSNVSPLWTGGFKRLTKDFPRLTDKEYFASGSTALNQGVLDLATMITSQALQVAEKTGTYPECVLAALTDGKNRQPPFDDAVVRAVLETLHPELFTLVWITFETSEVVDGRAVGKSLGFRDFLDSKAQPGETVAQQQKRFRNMMKVFSQAMVKRVSTSQVGKSSGTVAPNQSTNFFDQP